MNTIRAKIALLLVVAIVSVVGILTWVMIALLGPPPPQRTTEPLAEQVEMFLRVAGKDTSALTLVPEPAGGEPRENATERLRAELAKRGHALPVTISRKDRDAPLVVSIPIEGKGWLLMPISDPPPQRKPWYGLLKWLALITVGVSAVAIFAAHRMVQPLVLLENTVESVGPDAILPLLPEKGPAEVRATARALNSLSSRLRSAIESRMRLLAAAGHDLRTPITRMRLRAEFVEDDEEGDCGSPISMSSSASPIARSCSCARNRARPRQRFCGSTRSSPASQASSTTRIWMSLSRARKPSACGPASSRSAVRTAT